MCKAKPVLPACRDKKKRCFKKKMSDKKKRNKCFAKKTGLPKKWAIKRCAESCGFCCPPEP